MLNHKIDERSGIPSTWEMLRKLTELSSFKIFKPVVFYLNYLRRHQQGLYYSIPRRSWKIQLDVWMRYMGIKEIIEYYII